MSSGGSSDTVVFLHGLGVGPDSWDAQAAALPQGLRGLTPSTPGLADDAPFSLTASAAALARELDGRGVDRAHVCGLSLGGLIALRLALDFPDRVASLVVSGAPLRPNRALMALQSALMRVTPASSMPSGLSKAAVKGILREVAGADLGAELGRISARTLVLCGSRDRPNLASARELAAAITGAELQIVPGAGHQWNTGKPEDFSARLNEFLAST